MKGKKILYYTHIKANYQQFNLSLSCRIQGATNLLYAVPLSCPHHEHNLHINPTKFNFFCIKQTNLR